MDERTDYISWDRYFMGIARLSAMRSKDPRTQVGACIVDSENRILSVGYNGMPRGCKDSEFPWGRSATDHNDTKYPYVVHAEMNAILNFRGGTLEGSTLYVTMSPCCECAKAIIQVGIRKVIYADEWRDSEATRRMFEAAGVEYVQYKDRKLGLIYKVDVLNSLYDAQCRTCEPPNDKDRCDLCPMNDILACINKTEEVL